MNSSTRSRGIRDALTTPAGVATLALLATAAAFRIDLLVLRAVSLGEAPGVVHDYFEATETFGNGFGVVMIVLAVVVLDGARRVQTSRLLAASLGAGLVADAVKLCVSRTRPYAFANDAGDYWETFTGVLPLATAGSAGQSFPSAHTACAFGLAAALAASYPAGRRMFFAFAAGVALQRVCVGAHYVSDVIAGGFLGAAWAHAVCREGAISRAFDRMEAWWSTRFGWRLPADHGSLPTPAIRMYAAETVAETRRAA